MEHDFVWISKHDKAVSEAYGELLCIIRDVQQDLSDVYTFQYKFVGSYANNMITYDRKSNIGFDFDVNIYPNDKDEELSPKDIKLKFKSSLDKFARKYGYDFAEDSTRVLTIKVKDQERSRIEHSVDFCFVNDYIEHGREGQEYIRFNKEQGTYTWEEQGNGYHGHTERLDWIKKQGLWEELKRYYIYKKNINSNPHNKSRSVFASAVKEICDKYRYS